ncbi:MAG: TIGR00282 family metallophosphoesterase, partial [Exiguobacterium sp.]|nr:TIGR00282 family metallophosphoesterase [Exiguobacterium sp.]
KKIYQQFLELGFHGVTMGNLTWDNRDIFEWIDDADRIVRPANYPGGTPGVGMMKLKQNGKKLAVINVMGNVFLPSLDCPFRTVDRLVEEVRDEVDAIFVDVHAEATSEKIAMGYHLDGRAQAVVGTHTHVQTADERVLPNGTAYITDVGMTGPLDGVLGMDASVVLKKFMTQLPVRFEVAEGREQLNGVFITIDDQTKRATKIERIHLDDQTVWFD